jgi:hypothetical protein
LNAKSKPGNRSCDYHSLSECHEFPLNPAFGPVDSSKTSRWPSMATYVANHVG